MLLDLTRTSDLVLMLLDGLGCRECQWHRERFEKLILARLDSRLSQSLTECKMSKITKLHLGKQQKKFIY